MSEKLSNDYNIEDLNCPVCGFEEAKVITHILNIPYYTDYASISITCSSCGYRMTDFRNLTTKPASLMEYRIETPEDMTTKVVRSSEGIVTIPELGVQIEPTGDGTTWIRNIEGILDDIKKKLLVSLRNSETTEEKRSVKQRIKQLKRLKKVETPYSILVEDPSGNSIILPASEKKLSITYLDDSNEE